VAVVRYRRDLARRHDREAHAFLRQHVERLVIERGLREPHAFRGSAESPPEVGDPHRTSVTLSRRVDSGRIAW
jgi:hypothetical protein